MPTPAFLKKGSDNLLNGVGLGAAFGAAIIWGSSILNQIKTVIPQAWTSWSPTSYPDLALWVYIIGAGALIGYIIDRQ